MRNRSIKKVLVLILAAAMVLPLLPVLSVTASAIDVSEWNTTGWTQTTEDGNTVLTANSTDDSASLIYSGSMDKVRSIKADIRYNETRWGEASGGFIVRTGSGNEWFADYRADANYVRIRRNGDYITYSELYFTPGADQWVSWELCWDDTAIYLIAGGEQVLSCNYSGYGDVFDVTATFRFYEWGQPMSVKNVEFSSGEAGPEEPSTDVWSGDWTKTEEDEHTVYTANTTNDLAALTYSGSLEGVHSIEADVRYNETRWTEASGGFIIRTGAGNEWYADYRADGNYVRIRRNGDFITYGELYFTPAADQWMHWELCWDDTTLYLLVDGKQVLSCNYSDHGDVLDATAAFRFNEWGEPMSVREIKFNTNVFGLWNTGTYKYSKEDSVTVLTGNTGSNEQITYRGGMGDFNTVEADIRYNATETTEASAGIIIYTESGVEWYADYRADGGYIRIRRSGEWNYAQTAPFAIAADEWTHWKLCWDGANLIFYINDTLIAKLDYSAYGDVFGALSSPVKFNHWLQPMSVKNMKLSVSTFEPEEPPIDDDLGFSKVSVTLQSSLAINFKVAKADVPADYDGVFVKFRFNGTEYTATEYTDDGTYYVFTFRNIAPDKLGDMISATLYGVKGETTCTGKTVEYSVADYCRLLYDSTTVAKLQTLLVDLLNYGAEAQKYTGYNTDALVNANLTDEQKAKATSEVAELANDLAVNEKTDAAVMITDAGLVLNDAVTIRYKIAAESIDRLTIKVTDGERYTLYNANDLIPVDNEDGTYYLYFNGVTAEKMRSVFRITVYRDNAAVSSTVSYSVATYAKNVNENDEYANLCDLVNAMMKYGDAAAAYVG